MRLIDVSPCFHYCDATRLPLGVNSTTPHKVRTRPSKATPEEYSQNILSLLRRVRVEGFDTRLTRYGTDEREKERRGREEGEETECTKNTYIGTGNTHLTKSAKKKKKHTHSHPRRVATNRQALADGSGLLPSPTHLRVLSGSYPRRFVTTITILCWRRGTNYAAVLAMHLPQKYTYA